ncbi:MAG: DegT/DnrJ/EryC1/StrS family aminotransferase [Armatimonadetes bacterium]|nr:DegT/DnrJ/EryC1/StrS family aminotransferase [Armatimonadota bacterium]
MIRLAQPWIEAEDCDAVSAVLRTGNLVQGTRVSEFEQSITGICGSSHAIAASSGTAALHLALLALGIGSGDTVFVPAYSFPATANVVLLCGAQVRFVDIDPDTFCMDPEALRTVMSYTSTACAPTGRTVIMPVHAFGQCAPMEDICRIAVDTGAAIVEDAACALGSTRNGVPAGTWGVMGCFSFHPRKILTTGEGGAVVTNDPRLAESIDLLRNHGMRRSEQRMQSVRPGFNYRMSDVEAALGLVQAHRFETMLEERREQASYYDRRLMDGPVRGPVVTSGNTHTYQSYVVVLPESLAPRRDRLFVFARELGVELGLGTYHIPGEKAYQGLGSLCPVSEAVAKSSVSLPLHHGLDLKDQDKVVDCLLAFAHERS